MSETSIDELLSGVRSGPEHEGRPRRPFLIRLFSLLGFASAWTGFVFVLLRLLDRTVPLLVVFAVFATLVMLWRIWRGLKPPTPSRHAGRTNVDSVPPPADGLTSAISRWETMLDWCHTDAARYNRRVLPRLAEVADERLRQHHGITRASDPERARAILGDPLWTLVTMPVRRPPSPRELEMAVNALEKL